MCDHLPVVSSLLRATNSRISLEFRRAFSHQPVIVAAFPDSPPANIPSSVDQEFVSAAEEPATPEPIATVVAEGQDVSSTPESNDVSAIRSTPPASANITAKTTFEPPELAIVSIKDLDVIGEDSIIELLVEWSDGNLEWIAEEEVQQRVPDKLYAY
ncbi:hypothetical protein ACHAPU_011111 [Fusarium lateritium]